MESFETWFARRKEDLEQWVLSTRKVNFDRGIRNATVEKYVDTSHFIFELLQNADDEGATWARFELSPTAIIFDHDGCDFTRDDIEGLTGIGNTTKPKGANKIGRFGIGFKSVFVVTQQPQVHCTVEGKLFAFAIRDLVVPDLIEAAHGPGSTRYVLPLPAENATATVAKVCATLDAAGPRSLLYLKGLRRLEWRDGATQACCVVEDSDDGVRTMRTTGDGRPEQVDRFLVLSRPVRSDDGKSDLPVKIAMRLDDSGDIVPEPSSTRVAVFFETEEQPGLRFHVHGPFELTDNRANIKRDNAWNERLVDELAALLAASLPELRDLGLIKRSFLEVLPNGKDGLADPWDRLRMAAVAAFHEHALAPAHFGGHVRAGEAVTGPADIRDVLRDAGLAAFAGLPDRRWVIGVRRNSRAEDFLSNLDITEWGATHLLNTCQRMFAVGNFYHTIPNNSSKACEWFDALSDEVVQQFYGLIDTAVRIAKPPISLSNVKFVRLENGSRAKPSDARLPPTDAPQDDEAAMLGPKLVRSGLVKGKRGKDIAAFLARVGVKEISERDYLAAIIAANYAQGATPPTAARHMRHMRRFLKWQAEHGDVRMLETAAFLRVEGAEGFHVPTAVYLDRPFVSSGLGLIYDGTVKGRDRRPLWSGYGKLRREDLLALLKALKVEDRLLVSCSQIPETHPHRQELKSGFGYVRRTGSGENVDYTISQLPALLARSNPGISKLIWRAVAEAGSHAMRACYYPNQQHHRDAKRAPSTLALALSDAEWIPAKDGTLRRPSAITMHELADGFSIKGNEEWLNAIGFEADHRRRSEQHQQRRRAAEALGLPQELADELAGMSPDDRTACFRDALRRFQSGQLGAPEFPERESANPERRAAKMAERARAAPSKTYDVRERSVRTSDREARQLGRAYLVDYYTNDGGEMVCQACHQRMPFDLPDGSPYFEAPELLPEASAELPENHLALCPTCCAKWRHARADSDADVIDALRSAPAPQITVTLAGEAVSIRFVQVHLEDLRSIISVTEESGNSSAAETG